MKEGTTCLPDVFLRSCDFAHAHACAFSSFEKENVLRIHEVAVPLYVQGVHALGLVYLCAEDVRIVFVLEKLTEGVLEFRCC